MLYVRDSSFVVRGCAVSRRHINVCNCDMFSVVNVYLDHLKLCAVCINGRRYVCCGECYVVSNECDEPTSYLVQPIVAHCCQVMYFGCFDFRGDLGFLNFYDICMCVVNNQFELLEFVLLRFCGFLSLLLLAMCAGVLSGCVVVSTSPVFMRSSVGHPANSHGRLAQRTVNQGHHFWRREVSTQFAQQSVTAVTSPLLEYYAVWSSGKWSILSTQECQ